MGTVGGLCRTAPPPASPCCPGAALAASHVVACVMTLGGPQGVFTSVQNILTLVWGPLCPMGPGEPGFARGWGLDGGSTGASSLQEAQAGSTPYAPGPGTGLALLTLPEAGLPCPLGKPLAQARRSRAFSETSGQDMVGRQAAPGWRLGALMPPGHGACKVISCPVRLSPQTSNPLELTGQASAVNTLLQKAPGVGGSGARASFLLWWAFPPAWLLGEAHVVLSPRPPGAGLLAEPGSDAFSSVAGRCRTHTGQQSG